MNKDGLRFFARLLGCLEWVWIVGIVLLCYGQSAGIEIETFSLEKLTWFMMINTIAMFWIIIHMVRQDVNEELEKAENDKPISDVEQTL